MGGHKWFGHEKLLVPTEDWGQIVYHKFGDCSFLVIRTKLDHYYDLVDFEFYATTSIVLSGSNAIGTNDFELRISILLDAL
jgi:hypothetical protein